MKQTTLIFLLNKENNQILLGMKKRGFGSGKWNGFGGKVNPNESVKDGAIRELEEESNVKAPSEHVKKLGELDFFFLRNPEWNQKVHLFMSNKWEGEPIESEEMLPQWFTFNEIPFEKMWADDPHWLPKILNNENVFAEFTFGEDNETISNIKWKKKK